MKKSLYFLSLAAALVITHQTCKASKSEEISSPQPQKKSAYDNALKTLNLSENPSLKEIDEAQDRMKRNPVKRGEKHNRDLKIDTARSVLLPKARIEEEKLRISTNPGSIPLKIEPTKQSEQTSSASSEAGTTEPNFSVETDSFFEEVKQSAKDQQPFEPIPDTEINLKPGHSAPVTDQSPTATRVPDAGPQQAELPLTESSAQAAIPSSSSTFASLFAKISNHPAVVAAKNFVSTVKEKALTHLVGVGMTLSAGLSSFGTSINKKFTDMQIGMNKQAKPMLDQAQATADQIGNLASTVKEQVLTNLSIVPTLVSPATKTIKSMLDKAQTTGKEINTQIGAIQTQANEGFSLAVMGKGPKTVGGMPNPDHIPSITEQINSAGKKANKVVEQVVKQSSDAANQFGNLVSAVTDQGLGKVTDFRTAASQAYTEINKNINTAQQTTTNFMDENVVRPIKDTYTSLSDKANQIKVKASDESAEEQPAKLNTDESEQPLLTSERLSDLETPLLSPEAKQALTNSTDEVKTALPSILKTTWKSFSDSLSQLVQKVSMPKALTDAIQRLNLTIKNIFTRNLNPTPDLLTRIKSIFTDLGNRIASVATRNSITPNHLATLQDKIDESSQALNELQEPLLPSEYTQPPLNTPLTPAEIDNL